MRVNVFQITQFLEIGGLESLIVDICRHLDRSLFRPSVLCLNGYDDSYRQSLIEDGIPVTLLKKRGKYDMGYWGRVASYLQNQEAHVLHIHGGCLLYSIIISKLAGINKTLYTAHGMPLNHGIQTRLEEYISYHLTKKIVAVSDEIANDLRTRHKGISQKIETVINGVDTNKYLRLSSPGERAGILASLGLPATAHIIGTVGRLERVKNYSMLINAFYLILHKHNIHARLVFVGTGSDQDRLRKLVSSLGLAKHVTFLGMQYDLPPLYRSFDVFALSSLTEGTSMSLLEAQACGVPAVVTDVGGNPTIIRDGINGYLCPIEDHPTMADRITALISNSEIRAQMGSAARTIVCSQFSISRMLKHYSELYMRLSTDHQDPTLRS
jgi:L-malate glycosyltransferase